ncbi:hypothetical protein GCM10027569_22490 [Flindersiella endophytica]
MLILAVGVLVVASLLVAGFFGPQLLGRDRAMLTLNGEPRPPSSSTAPSPRVAPSQGPARRDVPAETGRKGGDSGQPPASPTASARERKVPPPGGTLCGASYLPEGGQTATDALAAEDRRFGDLGMARIFYGVPSVWPGRAGKAARTVVVSLKLDPRLVNAGDYDTVLRAWFSEAPRDRDIYWTLHHEPEEDIEKGEFTAAEYRSAWRRLDGFAAAASNPRLRATLILMDWSLDSRSGRHWRDYYPGGDVIDVLAFDVYNHGWKQDPQVYYSAAKQLSTIVATAKAIGKPWGLAELGSIKLASDSSGAGRAAWLRDLTSYAIKHKALFVSYFDIDYAEGFDYRLRDQPSISAWQAFCDR